MLPICPCKLLNVRTARAAFRMSSTSAPRRPALRACTHAHGEATRWARCGWGGACIPKPRSAAARDGLCGIIPHQARPDRQPPCSLLTQRRVPATSGAASPTGALGGAAHWVLPLQLLQPLPELFAGSAPQRSKQARSKDRKFQGLAFATVERTGSALTPAVVTLASTSTRLFWPR